MRSEPLAAPRRSVAVKVLGDTDAGPPRPVGLRVADACFHTHVVGATGSGKSTLLTNLAIADAKTGRGLVVVDPKGDLIDDIVDRLPQRCLDALIVIDPAEQTTPAALNVLEGDNADLVVDHTVGIFSRIFAAWWGPRTDDVLRSACLTLARLPGATLADIPRLLTDPTWRTPLIAGLGDRAGLGGFWDWYESLSTAGQAQVTGPVMNKLRAVLSRGFARDLLGSTRTSFSMDAVLDGGILLVRVPKGILGEDTARLVGSLVVARVWQAATARAGRADRPDASLYVDECQNFMNLPGALGDVLAEARGYHLGLTLAHQHLGQLPRDLADAVSANARNKIYFSVSPEDAKILARHTEPYLGAYDLAHLGAYQVACRLVVDGADLPAFTLRTRCPRPPIAGRAAAARTAARAHAGRTAAQRRHEGLVHLRAHRQARPPADAPAPPGVSVGVSGGVSAGVVDPPGSPGAKRHVTAPITPASGDPDSWSDH